MPPRVERFARLGIDIHRVLNGPDVGALVGLGVGLGLLLIWSAFVLPRPGRGGRAGPDGSRTCSPEPDSAVSRRAAW